MTRAELEAKIAANPHFKLVHAPSTGIVIPGAKDGNNSSNDPPHRPVN
jgi:hypothetical protein